MLAHLAGGLTSPSGKCQAARRPSSPPLNKPAYTVTKVTWAQQPTEATRKFSNNITVKKPFYAGYEHRGFLSTIIMHILLRYVMLCTLNFFLDAPRTHIKGSAIVFFVCLIPGVTDRSIHAYPRPNYIIIGPTPAHIQRGIEWLRLDIPGEYSGLCHVIPPIPYYTPTQKLGLLN